MKKALVIVAHPDDETIWMGGTILRNKSWNWTIFSLCRGNDEDRSPKFKQVCDCYGAQSIIDTLEDEKLKPLSTTNIVKLIKNNLDLNLKSSQFDYVYTHGLNGEYGHIRHKETHKAVKKMVNEGSLKCSKLFFFSYKLGKKSVPEIPDLRLPVPQKNGGPSIKLRPHEYKKKVSIIKNTYGFSPQSFECLSCYSEETFTTH
jgi:hypothetical protein